MSSFQSDYVDALLLSLGRKVLNKDFPKIHNRLVLESGWQWRNSDPGTRHANEIWADRHNLLLEAKRHIPELCTVPSNGLDVFLWLRENALASRDKTIDRTRRVHVAWLSTFLWRWELSRVHERLCFDGQGFVDVLATDRFRVFDHFNWDAPIVMIPSVGRNSVQQEVWFTLIDKNRSNRILQQVIADSISLHSYTCRPRERNQSFVFPAFSVKEVLKRVDTLPVSAYLARDFVGQDVGEVGVNFSRTIRFSADGSGFIDMGHKMHIKASDDFLLFEKPFVVWVTRPKCHRPLFSLKIDYKDCKTDF